MALRKTLVGIFGLIFTIVAFICLLVSFATPNWIESFTDRSREFVKMGLWEACFNDWTYYKDYLGKRYHGCWWIFSFEYRPVWSYLNPPWLLAIQVLLTIVFMMQMITILFVVFYFLHVCPVAKEKNYVYATTGMNFVSGLVIAICTIIFGVKAEVDRQWLPHPDSNFLSWSFGFAVLSGFFSLFGGMCLLVESLRLSVESQRNRREAVYGMKQYGGRY
ncbi:hypothetical protein LOTGIDRAFT_221390 [Lottia gigantea]|uniref:Uncharacterized protein n=1 Tax=Lottia gigantea TaxID=225164 RepID=V4B928_LOTGI|nr:hypothetical protein LOTGIDRAFT_221390 [Lottia gigantea]ESO85354.1 hypothetical protein LOTGIDRAFT_221390 [Lottia gigantea]